MSPRVQNLLSLVVLAAALMIASYPEKPQALTIHAGATLIEPVTDAGGDIRVVAVRDPFGNRFGIIENPRFKPADVR